MTATLRLRVASACLAAGALGLAACSSTSSGSDATSDAAGDVSGGAGPAANSATAAALKALEPFIDEQPITLPPLAGKQETGKTLTYVGCPLEVCVQVQKGVEEAVKTLGWTVKTFDGGLTPAAYTSAWDAVVQSPNDGVIGIGTFPKSTIESQLGELEDKGIVYAAVASVDPLDGALIATFQGVPTRKTSGEVVASWIVADSEADADVAYFWDPTFAQNTPQKDAFVAQVSSLCPDCSVDVQETNFVSGIGTATPPQIVSYLQRNPDVSYVALDVAQGTSGVPQALAAAGLADKVKIVSLNGGPLNFKNIEQGAEAMTSTAETVESGWRLVDVMLRHMEGSDISECCASPVGTIHVVTEDNPARGYQHPVHRTRLPVCIRRGLGTRIVSTGLAIRNLSKTYASQMALKGVDSRDTARPGACAARAKRLGEVDAHQGAGRVSPARSGRDAPN